MDGSTTLGSAPVQSSGQAVLTIGGGLSAGDHSITASYPGDTNFTGATTAALTQRVNKTATATTLTEASGRNGYTLTATVAASGSPTGTVDFLDLAAGTTLGSAALANHGATVALAAPLPVGHAVQAAYRGDATFAPSSSAAQVFLAPTNGFSFGPGITPDGVSSIFGAGLAGSTASATGAPLPTTLAGVTVEVVDGNGVSHAAGLYYVSPGQINFVLPADVPAGTAQLRVTTPNGVLTVTVTITRADPALASADGSGSGAAAAQVIVVHSDGTQEAPVTVTPAAISWGALGNRMFLVLYGTGLRHAAGPVSCSLNGQTVPVLYAGAHAVYPGLDQINLELPAGMHGAISVSCSVDGQASNTATVTVQ
jgi:uncharacterized protein (TIGR03437 family)